MFDFVRKRDLWEALDADLHKELPGSSQFSLKRIQDLVVYQRLRQCRGLAIAEVGGGSSRLLPVLSRSNRCFNIERFEGSHGGPGREIVIPGVENIKCYLGEGSGLIGTARFDVIFSISVIEHVALDQLDAFFREGMDALKPGGLWMHAVDFYIGEDGSPSKARFDTLESWLSSGELATSGRIFEGPLRFSCDMASNPDDVMWSWKKGAPSLDKLRQNAQCVTLLSVCRRAGGRSGLKCSRRNTNTGTARHMVNAASASAAESTHSLLPESPRESGRPKLWRPPGHFYSPIPDPEEIARRADWIWAAPAPSSLPAIDLNTAAQLEWLEKLRACARDFPRYTAKKPIDGHRFYDQNNQFGVGDALALHTMMLELRPKRIIEAGSGFSSAVMLDTNQHFLDDSVQLTFIEPYTERLRSLLKPGDERRARIVESPLQEVLAAEATALEPGDILFIDSTHVIKTGSDVNHVLFDVLPALPSGVFVHFHDISWPFEYPKKWVLEGRAWNESYGLRAFLMYNSVFRIALFISYLRQVFPDRVRGIPGGSYLWLRKATA